MQFYLINSNGYQNVDNITISIIIKNLTLCYSFAITYQVNKIMHCIFFIIKLILLKNIGRYVAVSTTDCIHIYYIIILP